MIRGISLLKGMPARLAALVLLCPVLALAQAPDFIEFESGHVRPLAMSPDGTRLFAVNTPDNALEIFSITASRPDAAGSRAGGPRAGRRRGAQRREVWVVNHLSDSVSVVTLSGTPRVMRTLLVGDEPRDIVFAGTNNRAFITTAHRGQHRTHPSIAGVPGAGDPQLTTPGVGRADVWVFDPASLGTTLGGTPVRIVTLFGDTPRALAVSPDGRTVYAAVFHSGNQTTTANLEARVRRLHHVPAVLHPQRPCAAVQQQLPGRPARPAHERRGQARARGRPDREVQQVAQPLGGRARPQLEQRDPLPAARPGRVRDRRRHARADGVLHRRRHHPLQHGREPGERQALRHQHRGAEPDALRGPGRVRRQHGAGQPRADAHHRDLRQRRSRRAT